jgi:cAMP phosphodiesterase
VAIERRALPDDTDSETFIRRHIKAYLISHAHLDHITGFLLNSPNDQSGKFIVALNQTVDIIRRHYFNNEVWADFASTGLKVDARRCRSMALASSCLLDVRLSSAGPNEQSIRSHR